MKGARSGDPHSQLPCRLSMIEQVSGDTQDAFGARSRDVLRGAEPPLMGRLDHAVRPTLQTVQNRAARVCGEADLQACFRARARGL